MATVCEHPYALKAVQHSDCRDASTNGMAANDAPLSPTTLLAQLHGKKAHSHFAGQGDAYYSGSCRSAEAGAVDSTGFSVRKI